MIVPMKKSYTSQKGKKIKGGMTMIYLPNFVIFVRVSVNFKLAFEQYSVEIKEKRTIRT